MTAAVLAVAAVVTVLLVTVLVEVVSVALAGHWCVYVCCECMVVVTWLCVVRWYDVLVCLHGVFVIDDMDMVEYSTSMVW